MKPLSFIKVLQYRLVQVLIVITLYLLIGPFLPLIAHQSFYTISLLIKDILVWLLPLTVGFFIAHTICSFEKKAPLFVLFILIFEALSNFSSVWYAYGCGTLVHGYLPSVNAPSFNDTFEALFRLGLRRPLWWSADKGTLIGIVIGLLISIFDNEKLKLFIRQGKEYAEWILTRIFSRLIPLFVLGFIARIEQTHLFYQIFAHYAVLVFYLIAFLLLYLAFLFFLSSDGTFKGWIRHIHNLLPAGSVALLSGCSLSTMPWTIEGTGKNLKNPSLAKAIIPLTTNIQQIGDCIINAFLCFLIYRHFVGHPPDVMTWLIFSFAFVLARFATAAVIGGAIFIMLPLYETHLSFNTEMIAMILAFNVILDPLVTSANVMANGALCSVFEKVWTRRIIGENKR